MNSVIVHFVGRCAFVLASACILSIAPTAWAQTPGSKAAAQPKDVAKNPAKDDGILNVGDDAPALDVDQWVKGKPVKSLEKGKGYVVEFWATWCPPCIDNIPHLGEIAKKNKNVTVIGVAASERKASTGRDDRATRLKNFVRAQGAKMGYTVAYDPSGESRKMWMEAAQKTGIPCAFVVDAEGKIAYVGHPANEQFEAKVKEVNQAIDDAKKQAKNDAKKKTKDDGVVPNSGAPEADIPDPVPASPSTEAPKTPSTPTKKVTDKPAPATPVKPAPKAP